MERIRMKLIVAAAAMFGMGSAWAQAASGVVISQFAVRGPAGGNDEFVELFNAGASPVAIGGWTLQGCANGTPGNASIRATVPAGVTLAAGQFYLLANPTAPGYSLGVAPDQTYATGFTDFSAAGFSGIRLVANATTTAGSPFVDAVGGGVSPCREGSGIVTPTANGTNTAFLRSLSGGVVQDSNNNAVDFPGPAAAGMPRNSTTILDGGGTLPTVSLSTSPASFGELGGSTLVTATLSAAYSAPVTVQLQFSGSASLNSDYSASTLSLTIPAGELSASATVSAIDDALFEGDETVVAGLGALTNAAAGSPATATATILDNEQAPPPTIGARIWQIQGASHRSPMAGSSVSNVPGIVTARAGNGFYIQDGDGDGDVATSDGIFVFTSSAPASNITVGAQVLVSGTVTEFRPGNDASNLSLTEITAPTTTLYSGSGLFLNPTILPTLLGNGGRVPPSEIIDNDSAGNVETSPSTIFDPAQDGLDFGESLEGMLVQINDARATGPRNGFGEIWVVGDNGANASGVNARGGISLVERFSGVDFNPERIQLDDGLNGISSPVVNVGDSLGTVRGVLSYGFGNFEVLMTEAPVVTSNPLPTSVRTIAVGGDRLSVGAYNVENLDPSDTSFARLAGQIVNAMGSPDVIALSELQDNTGATNNGIVAADQTIALLRDAIVAAGGPRYEAVSVDPVNNADGGEPGGNIRVVQFYNPLRISFVPGTAGAGGSLDATAPVLVNGKLALSLSPGRVAPTNTAWNSSRKPLAATYDFNGRRVVVVNVHFNSKGGDQPLYGVNQPAQRSSEVQRRQQATLVNGFVDSIQSLDPQARVLVLGDLNDFDFSPQLQLLRTGVDGTRDTLRNLGTALVPDPAERYSYVFEGNAQELDHILSTPSLLNAAAQYQTLHINAEYADQASDHDALLSSFLIPANTAPVAVAIATPATATSGDLVALDGSGSSDLEGSIASYLWTQTGGPTVSLTGANTANASFTAPSVSSATGLSFVLTVTDSEGLSHTAGTSVTVKAPIDTTPLPFSFSAVNDAPLDTATVSGSIMVLGINAPAAISVTGGEYSINDNAYTSMVGGVVNDGDLVRVRLQSANSYSTTRTATLSIDMVSAAFAVTTAALDATPDSFSFGSTTDARLGSVQTSAPVTIGGINAAVPITVNGGSYSVNGAAFVSTPGTVGSGDSVRLQGKAAGLRYNATITVTATIGGVTGAYTITTRRLVPGRSN